MGLFLVLSRMAILAYELPIPSLLLDCARLEFDKLLEHHLEATGKSMLNFCPWHS